jgi:hypothetical protein
MGYPQNVNRFSPHAKNASVATVKQMCVTRTESFGFRNQRASFGEPLQRCDLLFQAVDKLSRFFPAIWRNKILNILDVSLRRARDPNAEFRGHV